MKNRQLIKELTTEYDSFYLYDESIIIQSCQQLKKDYDDVQFLYSIKTNPNKDVAGTVFDQGFGVDAASLSEAYMGKDNGLSKDKIHYSAPGKSLSDIEKALEFSTVIADSMGELQRIDNIAREKEITANIGIRINPDFTFYSQKGESSKFGIDVETLLDNAEFIRKLKNVNITGIHVHSHSQELCKDILVEYYGRIFNLAQRVKLKLNINLKFINFGSGLGITYEKGDKPLDTEFLGEAMKRLREKYSESLGNPQIILETGRFVVGKSGVYVSKVMDKKQSRGKTIVILKNTLNGFSKLSLVPFVLGYASEENPASNEPLFTSRNAFKIIPITDNIETETVTLMGNLCAAADIVEKDIELTKLDVGDAIVFTNAGSYAAVITPMEFSSQTKPAQLFLCVDGKVSRTDTMMGGMY